MTNKTTKGGIKDEAWEEAYKNATMDTAKSDMPVIRTYKGKDINKLSKKELLEALNYAFDQIEEEKRFNDLERKIAAGFRSYMEKN